MQLWRQYKYQDEEDRNLKPPIIPPGATAQLVVLEADKADGGQAKSEEDAAKETPSVKVASIGRRWSCCRTC